MKIRFKSYYTILTIVANPLELNQLPEDALSEKIIDAALINEFLSFQRKVKIND